MNLELSHDAIPVSCDFFHIPPHHLLSQVEIEFVTHRTRQQERRITTMNYTSEVSIRCKPKAYEMLKKTYETNDIMPDKTFQDGDCHILYWGSIVWDEDNDVRVAAMATALKQLDDLFDLSDAKTTDYGYKMFRMDLRQQHFKCGGRC